MIIEEEDARGVENSPPLKTDRGTFDAKTPTTKAISEDSGV